jgi:hypothetical protein
MAFLLERFISLHPWLANQLRQVLVFKQTGSNVPMEGRKRAQPSLTTFINFSCFLGN